jgi:hypothetical protein
MPHSQRRSAHDGLEGKTKHKEPIMVSTMKRTIALTFLAAVGVAAASPAFAQVVAIEGAPHPSAVGVPFGYVSTANPSGQCWIMTDRGMGYGYWGACPQGVAVAPAANQRTQRRATTARVAVQAPPATGTVAVGAPAALAAPAAVAIDNRATIVAPATSASAFVAPDTLTANQGGFPFAYVNSPGPGGQCWVMTDKGMGYGYWGKCP